MASVYGIGLLHRHFDMSPDEILVGHGPTSTPWPVPPDPLNFMDVRIVPRSWYFPDASAEPRPYEFGFKRHDEAIRPASADPYLYGPSSQIFARSSTNTALHLFSALLPCPLIIFRLKLRL